MEETEGEFAVKMNRMPKYVVSTTLSDDDATWENSTVIRDDVPGAVARLKDEVDGDILVTGSGQLVGTLLDEGLVDELRLMIYPIIVGEGKQLFGSQSDMTELRLKDSKTIGPDGIIVSTYVPA
jgi:dihydrofolate reductase